MKPFILFAQALIFSFLSLPLSLAAQEIETSYPNYVVIGAFAHEKNAIKFTDEAKQNNYPARFEMNPNRNLYYVYVLTTHDREQARAEAVKLRTESRYFDTWVYSGAFGQFAAEINGAQQDFNPVTGQPLEKVTGTANELSSTKPDSGRETATSNPQTTNAADHRNKFAAHGGRENENGLTVQQVTSRQQPGKGKREGGAGPDNTGLRSADVAVEGQSTAVAAENMVISDEAPPVNEKNSSSSDRQASVDPEPEAKRRETPQGDAVSSAGPQRASSVQQQTLNDSYDRSEGRNAADENPSNEPGKTDRTTATDVVVTIPAPVRQSVEPLSSEEVAGKNFYFHLYRADNHQTIAGEVDAIDFEKSRKMGTYPANEAVKVTMAGGKMKHISFVCQVFGYRKQQQEFDPEEPSAELYLDEKGNLVVPFELVRLQKGDIAIMYNVFFFKDAAVMRPESRYEVNNLLDLLVENPSYNIVIHGHTNGNASGKIIRMDKPGNFYSLAGTKQGFGSAKQLSEERANVIRSYLVSSGISTDRMQVKAWGGKKPIHDKHSVRAQENVRVEIEILSE